MLCENEISLIENFKLFVEVDKLAVHSAFHGKFELLEENASHRASHYLDHHHHRQQQAEAVDNANVICNVRLLTAIF